MGKTGLDPMAPLIICSCSFNSAEDIEKAKKRGGRIDEGKTGWGLGLSIVRDIVDEYSGSFELGRSEYGGLKATVMLPGKSE